MNCNICEKKFKNNREKSKHLNNLEKYCFNKHKIVSYEKKKYVVIEVNYKTDKLYSVFDYTDLKILKYHWNFSTNGYIIKSDFFNGKKNIYLHHCIINDLKNKETVDHINRIPLDNRRCNLRIANKSTQNYNQNKKKRKVKLPEDCGINPDEIPKNIHYKKEKIKNGFRERFEVCFKINGKRVRKNSTSAKKYSLRIKLIHAIQILKTFRTKYPDIVKIKTEDFEKVVELRKSFNDILKLSGFEDINLIKEDIKPKYFKGTNEEYKIVKKEILKND